MPAGTGHIAWWWVLSGGLALLLLWWIYHSTRPRAGAVNRAMPKPDDEPPADPRRKAP